MTATTLQLGIMMMCCCGGCVRDFSCMAEDVSVFWHFRIRDQYSVKTPTCEVKEVHVGISVCVPLVGHSFYVSELFLN